MRLRSSNQKYTGNTPILSKFAAKSSSMIMSEDSELSSELGSCLKPEF